MGVTSIRLKAEIETPLEDLSKKLDRSKNYLINRAIKEFLDREFIDNSRWGEPLEALDSVKSGKLVDEKQVNNWLKSWGHKNELNPPKV